MHESIVLFVGPAMEFHICPSLWTVLLSKILHFFCRFVIIEIQIHGYLKKKTNNQINWLTIGRIYIPFNIMAEGIPNIIIIFPCFRLMFAMPIKFWRVMEFQMNKSLLWWWMTLLTTKCKLQAYIKGKK